LEGSKCSSWSRTPSSRILCKRLASFICISLSTAVKPDAYVSAANKKALAKSLEDGVYFGGFFELKTLIVIVENAVMNWEIAAVWKQVFGGTCACWKGKRRHEPAMQAEGRSWRYLCSVAAFKNPVPRE
jgi:hypothetical protein